MNKIEIVSFILALVGAFSWAPFVIEQIKKGREKTRLIIYPESIANIVENEYNSVFSIRIGILTEIKGAFINNILLEIRHENGQLRTYKWAQIIEHLSNTTISGNSMPTSKTMSAIGYNLSKDTYTEPYISFINPDFRAKYDSLMEQLRIKRFYLIQNKMDIKQLEISEPFIEMMNTYKKYYSWMAGKYNATIKIFCSDTQVFSKGFTFDIDETSTETFEVINVGMSIDKMKNQLSRTEEEKLQYDENLFKTAHPLNLTIIQ